MVKISELIPAASGGRTHHDGLAKLVELFETSRKVVRVNKKSWMHNELGWTYHYVVCETENRHANVGP
jgi:hypothetical protein